MLYRPTYVQMYTSFLLTNTSAQHSYNYNFFMRNIPYGTRLVKMKIKEDSKCQNCGCKEESLMHLYWSCTSTKRKAKKINLVKCPNKPTPKS